ncbi:MAG: preprotein translocase subunit SecY [Bradyrhizobium sp.]|uniref:preprotein translocase subunit SecY n=1 Tax=Bradyrhizobium sp. TaxID=376 RepID=UPI0025BA0BC1|nr:preprotein translocase subunit SecY [Bradyrhizobium sp.]MBI5262409.1 preprotein translocase subunit SecY [Bradyrhizobium sp.]
MNQQLARRIVFTIGALLVFRLGTYIPLPGIDSDLLVQLFSSQAGGILGMFNTISGGAVQRMAIFALALAPYLSAAIFIRVLAMVSGKLTSAERSGEEGRRRLARYTLLLTLFIAAFQAYGVASALQQIPGIVADPGVWFLLSATASLVGGVFFLVWLSELITCHGIGNGLALILCVGTVTSLPSIVAGTFDLIQRGEISGAFLLLHCVLALAFLVLMVFVESARRRVPLAFAERKLKDRSLPAQTGALSIKINSAGFLMPITLESWVLFLPLVAAGFMFGGATPWVAAAFKQLEYGQPLHLILGSIAVFGLAFFYTSYVLDPEHAAQRLHKLGGTIPGVEPGEPTVAYLDRTVSFTTLIGAVYLTALTLIPEALIAYGIGLPYSISGAATLLVVCTVLDIRTQARGLLRTNRGGEYK